MSLVIDLKAEVLYDSKGGNHEERASSVVCVCVCVTTLSLLSLVSPAAALVGANQVNSASIIDGEVKAADLATGAVTTVKILDANVTTAKIQDGAVTSAKILDGTIATQDIANQAVTPQKLSIAVYTKAEVDALISNLQTQVATLQSLLLHFSRSGNDVTITGANLHIVSGSGSSEGPVNGLGNLIIGYDEASAYNPLNRTGSHNIVVGLGNNYSSYCGIAASQDAILGAPYASVIGGFRHTALGPFSVLVGGEFNATTTNADDSVIMSGRQNGATMQKGAIVAGDSNTMNAWGGAIVGGLAQSVTNTSTVSVDGTLF